MQEDLKRQEEENKKIEMEKYKLEKDRLYSLNITGEELNNMRNEILEIKGLLQEVLNKKEL